MQVARCHLKSIAYAARSSWIKLQRGERLFFLAFCGIYEVVMLPVMEARLTMRVPEGLSVLPARFQAPRNTQVSKLALLDQPRNKPFLPQVFVRRLEAFFEKSASLQEAWQIM